jgi:tetratricopeptide (TPR) repeat protein
MKRLRPLASLVFALTLATTYARADEEPAQSDPIAEEARVHHRRGLELYDEGDYRLALVEFERAYEVSKSYKVLYNIGQVQFQLAAYAKARRALEQYLAQGGDQIAPQRRANVEKDLETLKTRTAILTVRVNVPDAEVAIEDQPAGKAPLEGLLVDAGNVRIVVTHAGYSARMKQITLVGGDSQVVTIDLAESKPDVVVTQTNSGLRGEAVAGWIVTGVLAAGTIGAGIAASAASSRYDDKRNTPISGSPEEAISELDRQRNLVRGLALTTDILAGLTLVAGGVSLYFTLKPKPDAPRVRVQGSRAVFSVGF